MPTACMMQLVDARVCSLDGRVCDSVAALNSAALVAVVAKNSGAIPSRYTVSVGNCSYPTQPAPAQTLSLAPLQETKLVFQVHPIIARGEMPGNFI
jgi:hypothetical protein